MNHRDLDRHITGNWGEDQYPHSKCDELGHSVAVSCTTGEHFCLRCNQPIEITRVGGIDTTTPVEHVMQNTTCPIEKLVRECPKCTGVGDTSKQYACVTCLANYMDEPKCARCESRYCVLDSESVCPVCREAEVNRDDGC